MLSKWFNNLKIKRKLILMVTIPILLLFMLTFDSIHSEWDRYSALENNYQFQIDITEIVTMMHELQLERGISAGYVGSSGKRLQDELQQQRKVVDNQMSLLQQLTFENKPWLDELHNELLFRLEERWIIRSAIDELRETSGFFKYYSDINASILNQIQRMGMGTDNAYLRQHIEAYGSLLWLKEYAGRERGLLNAVFSSGVIDSSTISPLYDVIAKQENILRNFRDVIATPSQRELLDKKLDDPAIKRARLMRQIVLSKTEKVELLNEIQGFIGYGGLIHHFKNYLLRGEERYRNHFVKNYSKMHAVVQRYLSLPGVSDAEINDLKLVDSTFRVYKSYLNKIKKIIPDKPNIKKIDRIVKIDDAPALAAITRLRQKMYYMEPEQWFQDATRYMNIIGELSNEINEDITQDMGEMMQQIGQRAALLSVLAAIVLLASLMVASYITKRLVRGIGAVTTALQRVKDSGNFDENIAVDSKDEIGEMAVSFNQLIFERKHVEEILVNNRQYLEKAKNEAETANQAKSEFLARMSHELRTPMNAILGFGQLMSYDKELSPSRQEDVREILNAGHHLLDLINDVLDLAKIDAGRIEIDNKPVACRDFIENVVGMTMPLALQRNITLSYADDHCDDVTLYADPTRLKEVMLNLLSNAVKYNHEGGTITVRNEAVSNNRRRISVIDTGDGISEDQLQNLFQPFERLGAENTNVEGTGIGLVIAKRIIEMMGGSIGVNSTPGEGTTFWFELGTIKTVVHNSDTQDLSQSIVGVSINNQSNYKILYVEDNPSNIRLIEHLLNEHTNIPLSVAMTAQKGLELAVMHEFDLILLDINLPDMDGIQLLSMIRMMDKHQKTPIVALSANAMPQNIEQAFEAGFSDYLTKPVNLPRLITLLHQFLPGDKQITESIVSNMEIDTSSSADVVSLNKKKHATK